MKKTLFLLIAFSIVQAGEFTPEINIEELYIPLAQSTDTLFKAINQKNIQAFIDTYTELLTLQKDLPNAPEDLKNKITNLFEEKVDEVNKRAENLRARHVSKDSEESKKFYLLLTTLIRAIDALEFKLILLGPAIIQKSILEKLIEEFDPSAEKKAIEQKIKEKELQERFNTINPKVKEYIQGIKNVKKALDSGVVTTRILNMLKETLQKAIETSGAIDSIHNEAENWLTKNYKFKLELIKQIKEMSKSMLVIKDELGNRISLTSIIETLDNKLSPEDTDNLNDVIDLRNTVLGALSLVAGEAINVINKKTKEQREKRV